MPGPRPTFSPPPPDLQELFLRALHRTLYEPSAQDRSPAEFLRDVATAEADAPPPPSTWREALEDVRAGQARDVPQPPLSPALFRGETLAPVEVSGQQFEDPWTQLRRAVPALEGLVHQIRYDAGLPANHLAEYDTASNTITMDPWLSNDPMGPTVLAHEVAHALGYSDRSAPDAAYGTNAVVNAIEAGARQRFPYSPERPGWVTMSPDHAYPRQIHRRTFPVRLR